MAKATNESITSKLTAERPRKKKRAGKAPAVQQRQPGLYYPVMTPEEFYEAVGKLKQEAEIAIDRLIAFVDSLEADPDVEANGDELDDNLPDDEDSDPPEEADPGEEADEGEDDGTDEPELGSFDRMTNQEHSYKTRQIGCGNVTDGEKAVEPPMAHIDARRAALRKRRKGSEKSDGTLVFCVR